MHESNKKGYNGSEIAHGRALTCTRKFFSLPIIIVQTTLAYREPALYSIRKTFSLNDITNIFLVEYVQVQCVTHIFRIQSSV